MDIVSIDCLFCLVIVQTSTVCGHLHRHCHGSNRHHSSPLSYSTNSVCSRTVNRKPIQSRALPLETYSTLVLQITSTSRDYTLEVPKSAGCWVDTCMSFLPPYCNQTARHRLVRSAEAPSTPDDVTRSARHSLVRLAWDP